jgi:hypothetical protein
MIVFCEGEGMSEQQACDEVGMRVYSMRGTQGCWLFGQGHSSEEGDVGSEVSCDPVSP